MLERRGWAAVLALVVATGTASAHAQRDARPEAFYILSRADPPQVDAARLPPRARPHYAQLREAARRIERLRARTWKPDSAQLEGARRQRVEARDALYEVLRRQRGRLRAAGWLLYGVAAAERAADSYVSALDAYQAALRSWGEDIGPEPTLDQAEALEAFRRAAALAGGRTLAVWARYFEAFALIQMHRTRAADAALRTVAAADGPHRLVVEACFRLGDHAFARGDWGIAARWYEQSLDRPPDKMRTLALYKLAWAHWLLGHDGRARRAVAKIPQDAPEPIAADADRLRALVEASGP